MNGESRLVKDNHGSGEIFGFRWSESSPAVYLVASANNGQTWRMVANAPASKCSGGSCSLFPNKILAVTQDSTGTVHALLGANDYGAGGGTFREYYVRIGLTYGPTSQLTGYQVQAVVALPDHKRSVNVLSDLRGDLKMINFGNTQSLMYILSVSTKGSTTQDIKVFMGRATTLTPSATTDFVGISGAAGDTKLLDSCTYTMPSGASYCNQAPAFFSTHNSTGAFAQNRGTKDIYVFIGPIEADYGTAYTTAQPEANVLRYIRLAWNGSGWTAGSPINIANDNGSYLPLLFNAQSGANYAWLMFLHPTNGITFGRVDASGYSTVTTPVAAANRNGWGVFTVAPDDSKIWAIWNISTIGGASSNTAQAYWNGSTWSGSIFTDTGVTTGDNSGMGGISGWNSGVAAILFRGTLLRNSPPIPMAASIWSN